MYITLYEPYIHVRSTYFNRYFEYDPDAKEVVSDVFQLHVSFRNILKYGTLKCI